MREKILSRWGELSAGHSWKIFIISIVIAVLSVVMASRLSIKMQWSDLMPKSDPMVQEFDKIREEYVGTANSIVVVVGDQDKTKAFAEEIVPHINALEPYVKHINYKLEEDFYKKHGLMLLKTKDLRNMQENNLFSDFNLAGYLEHTNDNFEDVYIGDEESLSDKEKEDGAVAGLDGLQYFINSLDSYIENDQNTMTSPAETANMLLIGDPYLISYDKRMLLIIIDPNFDIIDVDKCVASTDTIQALIDNTLENYPSLYAGLTGTIPLARDEMVYSKEDMSKTSIVALILVLILFIVAFRFISAPILAGLNLMLSVMFAAGMISLFVDSLNMMTAMFAVILIGLGIDFSIHIISLFYEKHAADENIASTLSAALAQSGAGIVTGAMTTSVAFFSLMISHTKGIFEMGLVLGVGIISVMLMTVFLLPSLLAIRERISGRVFDSKKIRPVEFSFLGSIGKFIGEKPVMTLVGSIVVSIILLIFALEAKYDYNYLNMEPKGIPSVALQDSMLDAFDLSPDFVMVTSTSLDSLRRIAEDARKLPSVSMVETITNYLPSNEQQSVRTKYIELVQSQIDNSTKSKPITEGNIGRIVEQLERLDMNIYEMGQMAFLGGQDKVDSKCKMIIGDPENEKSRSIILELADKLKTAPRTVIKRLNDYQEQFKPRMKELATGMANSEEIDLTMIPEHIKNRYVNEKGDRFLLTIFPKEQIWDYKFLARFTDQMQRLSESITGTPPLMLRLVYLIGEDGKWASLLALVVVFLLLWADFREFKLAVIALVPLITGAIWMVGLMTSFGLKFTMVNVMAIPMIIGIGIDDGVHLMHRFRVEGWNNLKAVLGSTGRAILLTSLTTIAGFGSLMMAKYRGFASLGSLLVIGVAACFMTSIVFLPSLVKLLKGRKLQ